MSVKKKAILLLILFFCSRGNCSAKEKINLEDRIIGSTFKSLAKAFMVAVDWDKLKKANIDKLKKMDEEKFKKQYHKVYGELEGLPEGIKSDFKINAQMTKKEAIRNIKSLDKKKIYQIIDSIPDTFIAAQFKKYLGKGAGKLKKNNLVKQINKFWNEIIEKTKVPNPL